MFELHYIGRKQFVAIPDSRSLSRTANSSPRNIRLASERRYQAFGRARISRSLRMSYLKDADPMSQTAARHTNSKMTKHMVKCKDTTPTFDYSDPADFNWTFKTIIEYGFT